MIRRFRSTVVGPQERGEEFGSRHASEVAATVNAYRRVFWADGPIELEKLGARALERIDSFSPELGQEIRGIAGGAGLPVSHIAAINARTEILAILGRATGTPSRGECSSVVTLGNRDVEPVAVQTWDWYSEMADNWLEWTIPFPDGRRVVTVTEFGILGKIGVNAYGVGVLFNILHHRDDGTDVGVPVHIIARHILDTATNVPSGLRVADAASTSASTSVTIVGARRCGEAARSAELWPGGPGWVLPTREGLLLHTNHFVSAPARFGDLEPDNGSDTFERYEVLRRGLRQYDGRTTADQILRVMADHGSGLCCHPDPSTPGPQYATLATVRLDVGAGELITHAGGPCTLPTAG